MSSNVEQGSGNIHAIIRKKQDPFFKTLLRLTQMTGGLTPENSVLPEPEKYMGQNFFVNPIDMDKIASLVHPDSIVIEVGSGPGVLSERIAERAKGVYGIELDPRFESALDEVHSDYPNTHFEIGDALQLPLGLLDHGPNTQIVSNLPFSIAGRFMARLVGTNIRNAVFFLGDTISDELHAKIGSQRYGHISLISQFFDVETVASVGPGSFHPKDSTKGKIVVMTPKDLNQFDKDPVASIFSHIIHDSQKTDPPTVLESITSALGISDQELLALIETLPDRRIVLPPDESRDYMRKRFFNMSKAEVRYFAGIIQNL